MIRVHFLRFRQLLNGKMMKYVYRLAQVAICIVIMIGGARAECPKRVCYLVTFQATSCEVREKQVLPPTLTERPRGLVLVPKGTEARPVACDRSESAVESSPEENLRITGENVFFYPTSENCGRFTGQVITLRTSGVCCGAQHPYACGSLGTLLEPVDIPKDIGCPTENSSQGDCARSANKSDK